MKHLYLFIVVAILSQPILASKLGKKIQSAGKGPIWSQGIMIGKISDFEKRGFIFKTNESLFYLGEFQNDDHLEKKNFVPKEVKVSFKSKRARRNLKKVDLSKPIIIKYKYLHPLNIFHIHESNKMALNVEAPTSSFRQTKSFRKFGLHFKAKRGKTKGRYGVGKKQGKIVSVNRWGFLGTTCTTEVHLGGLKKERRVTGYTQDGMPIYNDFDVPNINEMNIYDEAGCLYLEDAMRSQSYVELKTRSSWFEIWNKYSTTITEVKVIK